ncbi:putative E3 ubiquitin-protein ligase UBR7 isoform X1 [Neodiprion virginianus]|uniref:putative E3 ubiquitin-protein ligase UBR7 isoform X1 n=1 Tax=Neodiprion virginianus TaxID=2961670 RepID=UPI001EE75919|nr:putative E3 ubiquitin-protein ligase UBR7 isoform X1 [Neodiprion virginianus]
MAEKSADILEEDNSVTMLDVLQEENQLEEDAYAVLGASDDKNCTYNKGYIRQALYACKTCRGDRNPAGVCLACSFQCHEGHELVELYTKRHFRCDCGNSKFGDKKCSLELTKLDTNEENQYNQNFDGFYCTCARPYPDPEDTSGDEMLQCVVCEDWYHSKHLGCGDISPPDDYDELICSGCMQKHTFLWKYASKYSVNRDAKKDSSNGKDETVDVENIPAGCKIPLEPQSTSTGACFWAEGWRSSLCTCDSCKKTYEESGIEFLLDPMDSVQIYEEAGKASQTESQYERGMKALASLGHVQQLTAIEEFNNMKERLKEYLQKFAENKKIVREEDIKEFFSGMEANKRQKVVVPTFCR